ncbi:hypothetical protein WJX79_008604 [Trebouxia sp. C0005]
MDNLTGMRSTALHLSPDDTFSMGPPSGSAEDHNGSGDDEGASRDHEADAGTVTAPRAIMQPRGTMAPAQGIELVVLGFVMV